MRARTNSILQRLARLDKTCNYNSCLLCLTQQTHPVRAVEPAHPPSPSPVNHYQTRLNIDGGRLLGRLHIMMAMPALAADYSIKKMIKARQLFTPCAEAEEKTLCLVTAASASGDEATRAAMHKKHPPLSAQSSNRYVYISLKQESSRVEKIQMHFPQLIRYRREVGSSSQFVCAQAVHNKMQAGMWHSSTISSVPSSCFSFVLLRL